ncbi:hypothetical protein GA0070603_0337 [Micromonospora chersina]|uniref:Uncharacterized protein n=1 Tax=Micromonospora chersina TaxID=47854 RepID=A0A1C6TZK4_9ACTN|nr:hypothetical protein GA0070603_0337 [Micromonospora chersina]
MDGVTTGIRPGMEHPGRMVVDLRALLPRRLREALRGVLHRLLDAVGDATAVVAALLQSTGGLR